MSMVSVLGSAVRRELAPYQSPLRPLFGFMMASIYPLKMAALADPDALCFSAQIRFSRRKLFVDVKGMFVSQTRLTCITPNFTDTGIPPGTVDVRVCLAGESFTTTKADFTFFPVTDAGFCFMYGPGLLEEGVPGRETTFVIQVD